MKLSYYPGCSIHASAAEYEISAKCILQNFDLELEEIEDWNCCGAIEASSLNHLLSLALPARNLTIVGQNQAKVIMLCSACQQIHNKAKQELIENEGLKQKIEKIIEKEVNTNIEIRHLLYFVANEIGENRIKLNVRRHLNNLRVVPYYGCSVNRPSIYIHGDNPEFPQSLEKIITAMGGVNLPSSYKTKCCGGTLLLTNEKLSSTMTKNILSDAKNLDAECIVVVCPLCHLSLETISLKSGYEIPIIYFTELMGISFGYQFKDLGLNRHLVSTQKLLEKLGVKE